MTTLKIVVCAEISGQKENDRLFTECTPAEIRRLLSVPANKLPLCDLTWWTSPDRKEDLWPLFVERLSAQLLSDEGDYSPGQPALCLRFDKSEFSSLADRIDVMEKTYFYTITHFKLLPILTMINYFITIREHSRRRKLFSVLTSYWT